MSLGKRVGIGLAILLVGTAFVFGQSIFQCPRPDSSIRNLVPPETALRVATVKAREIARGEVSLGNIIFCSDRTGRLGTYLVVFKVNGPFPGDREIQLQTRDGGRYRDMIAQGEYPQELTAALNQAVIVDRLRRMGLEVYRPDGTLTGMYRRVEKEELLKMALRMEYGVEDFISVYVSASFDAPPIPYIKKSLPPYYYSYETAGHLAAKLLASSAPRLSQYYFLGHGGEYFEFRGQTGKVLIDAYSQEVIIEAGRKALFAAPNGTRWGEGRMKAYQSVIDADWKALLIRKGGAR
jgi:hypothetical protein